MAAPIERKPTQEKSAFAPRQTYVEECVAQYQERMRAVIAQQFAQTPSGAPPSTPTATPTHPESQFTPHRRQKDDELQFEIDDI